MLDQSVIQFAQATAAKAPTPGGGSVAGVVGSLAVALGEMSLNFTRGKKKFAEYENFYEPLAVRLEQSRNEFLQLVNDDMQAFGDYNNATAMPEGPEKTEAQAKALAASIEVPRKMARLALSVEHDLLAMADKCNPWLLSDLVAAATLASAVTVLSDLNVRINAKELPADEAEEFRLASSQDRKQAAELAVKIEQQVKEYLP